VRAPALRPALRAERRTNRRVLAERAANSSRFVDYVALERRLDSAASTLERMELETPRLQAEMPLIARGAEELGLKQRQTTELIETCWSAAQSSLDGFARELCDDFDAALASSNRNLLMLRAEMARSMEHLEMLAKPEAGAARNLARPNSAGPGRPPAAGPSRLQGARAVERPRSVR